MTIAPQFDIIRSPIITEKSTALSELNKFAFKVSPDATKTGVKNAIQTLFKVEVQSVNILNVKGKVKLFRGRKGKRSDYKKAIVTLTKGQTLDFTAGV
ncbi:MAG: 50S ribosomal protein L23 [Alphaproteobacteria bacterium]|nr:50S ribosomal protein L23 [Alphaproteobacteria bacterium]